MLLSSSRFLFSFELKTSTSGSDKRNIGIEAQPSGPGFAHEMVAGAGRLDRASRAVVWLFVGRAPPRAIDDAERSIFSLLGRSLGTAVTVVLSSAHSHAK